MGKLTITKIRVIKQHINQLSVEVEYTDANDVKKSDNLLINTQLIKLTRNDIKNAIIMKHSLYGSIVTISNKVYSDMMDDPNYIAQLYSCLDYITSNENEFKIGIDYKLDELVRKEIGEHEDLDANKHLIINECFVMHKRDGMKIIEVNFTFRGKKDSIKVSYKYYRSMLYSFSEKFIEKYYNRHHPYDWYNVHIPIRVFRDIENSISDKNVEHDLRKTLKTNRLSSVADKLIKYYRIAKITG